MANRRVPPTQAASNNRVLRTERHPDVTQYHSTKTFPDAPALPQLEQEQEEQEQEQEQENNAPNGAAHAKQSDIDDDLNEILGINNNQNKNQNKKRQRQIISDKEATTIPNITHNTNNSNQISSPPKKKRKVTNNSDNNSKSKSNSNSNSNSNSKNSKKKKKKKPQKHQHKKKHKHKHSLELQEAVNNEVNIWGDNALIGSDWTEFMLTMNNTMKTFANKQNKKHKEQLNKLQKKHSNAIAKAEKLNQKLHFEHKNLLQKIRARMDRLQNNQMNESTYKKSEQEFGRKISELLSKNKILMKEKSELHVKINCLRVEKKNDMILIKERNNELKLIRNRQQIVGKNQLKELDNVHKFKNELLEKNKALSVINEELNGKLSDYENIINEFKCNKKNEELQTKIEQIEQSNKLLVDWNKSSRNKIQEQSFVIDKYKKKLEIYENVSLDESLVQSLDEHKINENENIMNGLDEHIFDGQHMVNSVIWEENDKKISLKSEIDKMSVICKQFNDEKRIETETEGRLDRLDRETKKKLQFKNKYMKYKNKSTELEQQIQKMKDSDWRGEIVKEYKDENGNILYDMRWEVSSGMTCDDLCEQDLKTWHSKKKKKKRLKCKINDDDDSDL